MSNLLIFAFIYGLVGASFAMYSSRCNSQVRKEKKEEALKKKFFIE